jgi:cephalosporin-C deacetylase
LEELQQYKPQRNEPQDFDDFWKMTLEEARQHPLQAVFQPTDFPLELIDAYDVSFNGYGGQPIKVVFMLPKGAKEPLPCVVNYIGYGGGRGFPTDWLLFPSGGMPPS